MLSGQGQAALVSAARRGFAGILSGGERQDGYPSSRSTTRLANGRFRGLLSPDAATRASASDLRLHLIAQRVDGAGLGHDLDTVGRDSAAGPERGLLDVRGPDHAREMRAGRKRRRVAVRPRVPGRPERHAIRCRRGALPRLDRRRRNGRGRGNRRILTVAAGGPSGRADGNEQRGQQSAAHVRFATVPAGG